VPSCVAPVLLEAIKHNAKHAGGLAAWIAAQGARNRFEADTRTFANGEHAVELARRNSASIGQVKGLGV
jgi:hypothetical protein